MLEIYSNSDGTEILPYSYQSLSFCPSGFGLIEPKFGGEKCVCTKQEEKGLRKGVSTMINVASNEVSQFLR